MQVSHAGVCYIPESLTETLLPRQPLSDSACCAWVCACPAGRRTSVLWRDFCQVVRVVSLMLTSTKNTKNTEN